MKSRRQALALAGALTLTVFTAAAAVAGMSSRATSHPATPVVAAQPAAPVAAAHEGWDD